MGFRIVVISSRAKLDYKMNYMVVRTDEKTTRVHLDEIAVLIIETTAVALTAYLIAELSRKKIKVIFCDEKYNPTAELCSLYGAHDTSRKLREQIRWQSDIKGIVWAEIVRAKILGQMSNLKESNDREIELLHSYAQEVQPHDSTNREAHAAKVYFNALFGLDFSRSEDNLINTALNYGYGILLSAINREVVACGYVTQLGIFHDNVFNHFNLSSDLIEPFRPFVDREVLTLNGVKFEHEEKMKLVDVLNSTVKIKDKEHHLINAISIFIHSVFEALAENDVSKLTFPKYEL
ncbi:MAG: type II CRISPR-associated endonuclease Cas1 [Bacteroides sp.]|nr:type II CRISPR-associated endonuclease Cas1 [Bacillota bacterium]MCM1455547.1 type II CRISPR-associated endonuclease Cas1 [Bacteroides sp.]